MKPWAKNTANLIQSNTVHCTLWQLPAQDPLHSVKYKHKHHKKDIQQCSCHKVNPISQVQFHLDVSNKQLVLS